MYWKTHLLNFELKTYLFILTNPRENIIQNIEQILYNKRQTDITQIYLYMMSYIRKVYFGWSVAIINVSFTHAI